jgi:hypothetical protein
VKRVALLCSVSCALGVSPALADEPDAGRVPARRLEYARGPGAETCPESDALHASVAANVGYDPFQPDAPRRLIATITRRGGAFVALMEERDAAGAQTWAHPPLPDVDCRNLVRTMGLSIAIAIDPFPKAPQAPTPPVVVLVTPPAPAPSSPSPPAAAAPPPPPVAPSARPRFRVGLAGAAQMGIASSVAAALTAQLGVRWPLASVSVEGRADLPVVSDAGSGPQVRSMLAAGALVPCGHIPLPLPEWNVAACGLLAVGVVRAERLDLPVSGAGLYVGAGARVSLEFHVGGPVALRVTADMLGSVKPASIQILHGQGLTMAGPVALTTAPVTGGLGGGVVADF